MLKSIFIRRAAKVTVSDLATRIKASGLFDAAYYLAENPDVAQAGVNPILHYVRFGANEGRDPNPLFDTSWYLDSYPDVAKAGVNPLVHYLEHGAREGRSPHPDFDAGWYRSAHPDVASANLNPLAHFLAGMSREQTSAPGSARPARAGVDDLDHAYMQQAVAMDRVWDILSRQSERTEKEAAQKLADVGAMLPNVRFGRAEVFREMARLARKCDAHLIAATYHLRLMHWLGRDGYNDLPYVVNVLNSNNFNSVAAAAAAMYESPSEADLQCRAILDRQADAHRNKPHLPLAQLDDRRANAEPKVSVIVSLYNAGRKLGFLLDNLAMQSLLKQAKLEIILIDSNSPANEYEIFTHFVAKHGIPIVYARSQERETIQAAWNRGIQLGRAPYLCFLGADEGLQPDALEILASALDINSQADWAMSDSAMTNVDERGQYLSEGWFLNRTGLRRQLIQLDPTYLTFVGGLHRKSIHDRFGYFDESFRAAGDTEFKSRVLRNIETLHVPKVLGFYNNFPDDRVTENPVAELEDVRAWYIHRTTAGIAYSYDGKPKEDAEALVRLSLGFRRSYRTRLGTDFDMAANAAAHLSRHDAQSRFAGEALKAARRLLACMRDIELLDHRMPAAQRAKQIESIVKTATALQSWDAGHLELDSKPTYDFFSDTRFLKDWLAWPVEIPANAVYQVSN